MYTALNVPFLKALVTNLSFSQNIFLSRKESDLFITVSIENFMFLCLSIVQSFINHLQSNWLKNCPKDFKPVYYKRYVDDIFVLFNKPEHAQFFLEYMNKKHKNMKFSIETEINGSLSFLDVKIFRENDKFVTSVFRKETFSGVYTNFISFIPLEYKFGLVHTLLNRCFNLSSDFLKFHHEVDKLKKILSKKCISTKVYW